MIDDGVAAALERQRRACAAMGSQLYAAMLQYASDEYREQGAIFAFFRRKPQRAKMSMAPLRLLGAAHFLALDGTAPSLAAHLPSCGGDGNAAAAWGALADLLWRRERDIAALYADTPQTNETARALPLLAGLCAVHSYAPLPIRLFELGASAGLNCCLDRFRYEGDGWSWGDAASPLVLRNSTREGAPKLGPLAIAERHGCDVHPLDVTNERDRMRLLSFVWPDQLERIARLQSALAIARGVPMHVDRGDAIAWLRGLVRTAPGSAAVVMHSVVADHLDETTCAELYGAIAERAATARPDAPFAWLRMEMDQTRTWFETRVTLWPGGEERLIASSDGHGQGIRWSA